MSNDAQPRQYAVTIGGVQIEKNGSVICTAGSVCRYEQMSYAHAQRLWHLMTEDETILQAMGAFQGVLAIRLVELGDQFGVERSKATPEEIKASKQGAN